MSNLRVPKAAAESSVPVARTDEAKAAGEGSKSLTVRLTLRDYWALRDFCAQHERQTGDRLTHQDALVRGLHCPLEREREAA